MFTDIIEHYDQVGPSQDMSRIQGDCIAKRFFSLTKLPQF